MAVCFNCSLTFPTKDKGYERYSFNVTIRNCGMTFAQALVTLGLIEADQTLCDIDKTTPLICHCCFSIISKWTRASLSCQKYEEEYKQRTADNSFVATHIAERKRDDISPVTTPRLPKV